MIELSKNAGINWAGRLNSNRDEKTGFRYGVISQNEISQAWCDSAEADYGDPHCPKCGRQADKLEAFGETFANGIPNEFTTDPHECDEFACVDCNQVFGSESAFGDTPNGFYYDRDGITAACGEDGDIFVTKSPYFTYAQFCSPCAPGACYLIHPVSAENADNRCYCFGHDWFEDGAAPYPVYSVETGAEILPA